MHANATAQTATRADSPLALLPVTRLLVASLQQGVPHPTSSCSRVDLPGYHGPATSSTASPDQLALDREAGTRLDWIFIRYALLPHAGLADSFAATPYSTPIPHTNSIVRQRAAACATTGDGARPPGRDPLSAVLVAAGCSRDPSSHRRAVHATAARVLAAETAGGGAVSLVARRRRHPLHASFSVLWLQQGLLRRSPKVCTRVHLQSSDDLAF